MADFYYFQIYFGLYPKNFWSALISFFPYKPSIGNCAIHFVGFKIAIHSAVYSTAENIYAVGWGNIKEFPSSLALKELQLQKHSDLIPIGNNA